MSQKKDTGLNTNPWPKLVDHYIDVLITKAAQSKKAISVTTLYDAIESNLPDNSHLRGTFSNFVNDNGYEINQHIEPTLNSAKKGKLINVVSNDESFKAEILRKQIGHEGSGKPVEYIDGKLVFSVTDNELKKELMKLVEANKK